MDLRRIPNPTGRRPHWQIRRQIGIGRPQGFVKPNAPRVRLVTTGRQTMGMHLLGADTPFSQGISTGIRLLLLEENSFVSEQDLVDALRVRVIGADDEVAREAGAIAWAITWLHPLALGFFVFGLCANHGWFDGNDSDDYVSRLLRVTPHNHAREA